MRVTLNIKYFSDCEQVKIIIKNSDREVILTGCDNTSWSCQIELSGSFYYKYKVGQRVECGKWREINCCGDRAIVYDSWRDQPQRKEHYSSFFEEFIYNHKIDKVGGNVVLKVKCGFVKPNQYLAIVGSSQFLGGWDVRFSKPMTYIGDCVWAIPLQNRDLKPDDQFKFVIKDSQNRDSVEWECGQNRVWNYAATTLDSIQVSDLVFSNEAPFCRFAGVAIPVFSLRSDNSAGIGDFDDLLRFTIWASSVGMRVVQILPVNDTTNIHTYKDSYPYNSISTIALHPIYLSIEKMGALRDVELAHFIADKQQKLNSYEDLDYEAVEDVKSLFFRAIYEQDGVQTIQSEDFKLFYKSNKSWLVPYCLFCHLRDVNKSADFSTWGVWATYSEQLAMRMVEFESADHDKIMYYAFLQFHLDKQLKEVRQIAKTHGVALKGDIPIGIAPNSVEAWTEPQLFNLDKQAGAPPDDFAVNGQNWGFPTYNWSEMAKDNFQWWKRRLKHMAQYFDLYRIDHILGFFRIWQIPIECVDGIKGQFNPALPFSCDELDGWGFKMEERFFKPLFSREMLGQNMGRFFSRYKEFFQPIEKDLFEFKEEFDNQKKVALIVADDEIKSILFSMLNEVLFVVDGYNKSKFHPRIVAQKTFLYQSLDDYQRWRFDELYNHFFYERHNSYWAQSAMSKLPVLIDSTGMLCCAEDLGMVPQSVSGTLKNLQVLTLEVERMSKNTGEQFANTDRYPYLSVCTTSTHDISPVRLFWQEGLEDGSTQHYWNDVMHRYEELPKEAGIDICKDVIRRHFESPSMLAILPLQDYFGIHKSTSNRDPNQERINIPSDPNHYWKYRMQVTIEQLEENVGFKEVLKALMFGSGRETV